MDYRVDFRNMEWESPAPHVRVKVQRRDGKQLRLVEFSKGFVEPDWCTKGHAGYLLAGEMELELTDRKIRFTAGDGVILPAGGAHKHKAHVLTDTVVLVLVEDVE